MMHQAIEIKSSIHTVSIRLERIIMNLSITMQMIKVLEYLGFICATRMECIFSYTYRSSIGNFGSVESMWMAHSINFMFFFLNFGRGDEENVRLSIYLVDRIHICVF